MPQENATADSNVLRLIDSEGNVLLSITLPHGTYTITAVQQGREVRFVYGPAVVIQGKRVGW